MNRFLPLCVSFLLVALGQPVHGTLLCVLCAAIGYAGFFVTVADMSARRRFWIGTLWYAGVQTVQLGWLLSHWYSFIYFVVALLALILGLQFGLLVWLGSRQRLVQRRAPLVLAGAWVLLEYSRLYWFTGFPFNVAGMALASHVSSLQCASLAGAYGLSFWVLLTNVLAAQAWIQRVSWSRWGVWLVAVVAPYGCGEILTRMHDVPTEETVTVAVADIAFPPEEVGGERVTIQEYIDSSLSQWHTTLKKVATLKSGEADFIVLPEGFVPFGADYPIYPYEAVQQMWRRAGLPDSALPPLEEPLARYVKGSHRQGWLVSNSFVCEGLCTARQADVVIGLEAIDRELNRAYNAAHYYRHDRPVGQRYAGWYGKQVLLPMAEYIPAGWLKKLAARYGIQSSYTPGGGPGLFEHPVAPLAPSVCYEEIYGRVIRKSGKLNPRLLINVTSDVWYPHSLLAEQHWAHGRLRTVENGLPMVRACNDGVSGAVDALGRVVGRTVPWKEWGNARVVTLKIPLQSYATLYLAWGDRLALAVAGLSLLTLLYPRCIKEENPLESLVTEC